MKKRGIIQTRPSSDSGFGVSFWKNWMGCHERAYRRELERKSAIATWPKDEDLAIGVIVHAYMELYYSLPSAKALALDTTAVVMRDDNGVAPEHTARTEAERLFRSYRVKYTPEEIGQVLAVEEPFDSRHESRLISMLDTNNTSPFTGRWDLVTKINKRVAKAMRHTRGIDIEPGVWIVDHKTDSLMGEWRQAFIDEIQFTLYMLAWLARTGTAPKGTLVNVLGKTKNPTLVTIPVTFPSPAKIKVARNFLAEARKMREEYPTLQRYNVTHCYGLYKKPCVYMATCQRG